MGKTTCAAAFAVAAARRGDRTLLISTDPAPSAGDALGQRLTATPAPVKGVKGLHAAEVDAKKGLERWLRPRREVLETIVQRGTWLDRDDVARLLRLSLPGIDEIAALLEIGRLGRARPYTLVVVDTAPTGHTLRMLAMPGLLESLATVFDRMQSKHRAVVEALRGRWTPEAPDRLISEMAAEARMLATLLRDRTRTAVSWVTLPEPMSITETRDAVTELRRLDLHVDQLIVNRVTPAPAGRCAWCSARRAFEADVIRSVTADAAGLSGAVVTLVASRPTEPRGPAALAALAAEMSPPTALPGRRPSGIPRRTVASMPIPRAGMGVGEHAFDGPQTLLMFGGKGGVGKTTCAAAAAIQLACADRGREVLLLSADPAHSVGDALGVSLDDEPRRVPGAPDNLLARELDAAARFEAVKIRYRRAIDALFERGSGLSSSGDREAMQDLLELAPPGLDEIMAIVEVADSLGGESGERRMVVLDTAPTGHALRLLEMPAVVHGWVKALMAIMLKYQPVVGIGELGDVLLQLSQSLGRFRARLSDPARTAFVVVTRAAELPAAETRRLLRRLHALNVEVPMVILNALGAGTCRHCAATRSQQRRVVMSVALDARRHSAPVILAPAVMPPPHRPAALQEWQRTWTRLPAARRRAAISSR